MSSRWIVGAFLLIAVATGVGFVAVVDSGSELPPEEVAALDALAKDVDKGDLDPNVIAWLSADGASNKFFDPDAVRRIVSRLQSPELDDFQRKLGVVVAEAAKAAEAIAAMWEPVRSDYDKASVEVRSDIIQRFVRSNASELSALVAQTQSVNAFLLNYEATL